MAPIQQWMAVFTRWGQGVAHFDGAWLATRPGQSWRAPQSSHPAPPAWMVPAYQRRRLSGDRLRAR